MLHPTPKSFIRATLCGALFLSTFLYAGPVSFEVDVYFSPNGGAQTEIIRLIGSAKRSIDVAMYSFSSTTILAAFREATSKGVKVRLIYDDGGNNEPKNEGETAKTEWSERYQEAGMDVRYIENLPKQRKAKRKRPRNNRIMHEKFMIVDGFPTGVPEDPNFSETTLTNASGNFSTSSDSRYNENMVVVKNDPWLITEFQKEFHRMWQYSYDYPSKETFSIYQPYAIDENVDLQPSVSFRPYFTSANFESSLRFENIDWSRVVSEQLEQAILNARESIHVATGHFRLMLLANALIDAKKNAEAEGRPLDIKVVSDSQEHIREWQHQKTLRDYYRCVKEKPTTEQFGMKAFASAWQKVETQMALELEADPRPIEERYIDRDDRYLICEMQGGYYLSRYLTNFGIPLRLKYYSYVWHYEYEPQMHNKYVIIDGKEVWAGSYNWSQNAEFNSFENVIRISGSQAQHIVDAYEEDFSSVWKMNRGKFAKHKEKLDKWNKFPIHFSGRMGSLVGMAPMGLSIPQIDELIEVIEEDSPSFFREVNAHPEWKYWIKSENTGVME